MATEAQEGIESDVTFGWFKRIEDKACSYVGENLETPCNLCCATRPDGLMDYVLRGIGVMTKIKPSERKMSSEDIEISKMLGLELSTEHQWCSYTKNGKCEIYDTDDKTVNEICKGFKCLIARNFGLIMFTQYANQMLSDLEEQPDRLARIDVVNGYAKAIGLLSPNEKIVRYTRK